MTQSVSRHVTLLVVCVAHFLMPFMMSAVGVALPVVGREFAASAVQLGLVETTYVLSASIFLPAMGRLGDIIGRRRIFQIGLAIFTVAGGLISQIWSIEGMIVLRFFQGMGGAMVMATTMAIVVSVFPAEERGKALGIAVACVYAGISCGPVVGGLLVSGLGWRSIFYLCVPLGLAALILTTLKLRGDWADARGEPFDWRGWLLYVLAIALLVDSAIHLERGWSSGFGLLAGVLALFGFYRFEQRQPYPMFQVDLLRNNRVFALSNLAALLNYAGTFGVTFFISLYLQYVKGMSAQGAGLVLIVQPLLQTVFSPWCGRLADRFAAAKVATFGMALCALGLAAAATIDEQTPLWGVMLILAFLGLGFALFSSPNTMVIMGSVPKRYLGMASGFAAGMRTLGMLTSMAIITLNFTLFMGEQAVTAQSQSGFLASMHSALLLFSGLCVLAVLSSIARQRPAGG